MQCISDNFETDDMFLNVSANVSEREIHLEHDWRASSRYKKIKFNEKLAPDCL